jgi:hypothetical protein
VDVEFFSGLEFMGAGKSNGGPNRFLLSCRLADSAYQDSNMENLEDRVKRLVLEMKALRDVPPEKFDPKKASELEAEFNQIARLYNMNDLEESDRRYFAMLQENLPKLFKTRGRPHWIESKKVKGQDDALLKEFEEARQKNIVANGGKAHRASQKAYTDLADKHDDSDDYTVKQRVMRARRRQKAFEQSKNEILETAALAKSDGNRPVSEKEYKKRQKKLVRAFQRILTMK